MQTFKGVQHMYINNHWRILGDDDTFVQMEDSVITVKYHSSVDSSSRAQLELSKGLTRLRKSDAGYFDYKVNADSIFSIANFLNTSSLVKYIQLNYHGKLLSVPCTPNDPYYTTAGAHLDIIKAPDMWNLMYCILNVHDCHPIVAVIDNGLDISHPDLGMGADGYENIFKHTGEDAWSNPTNPLTGNNVDDDNNGFIDDWKGWDFTSDGMFATGQDNDVKYDNWGIPTNDPSQHGTKVAGIIAAKTNNGIGISGIAGGWANMPGAQIMAVNIDNGASINESLVDDAIDYARKNGAKVLNLSFALNGFNQAVEDALKLAHEEGIIIVGGSGNNLGGFNWSMTYPSKSKYCISVGASDNLDQWEYYSCYSNSRLDVIAPKANSTTYDPQTYLSPVNNGTSFSAPLVSGVSANMLCFNPCITTEWARDILRNTADKVTAAYNPPGTFPEGHNEKFGYGRLNAYEAVKTAQSSYSSTLDLYIKDCPKDFGATGAAYGCGTVTDASPDIWVRLQDDGTDANGNLLTDEHEAVDLWVTPQVYVYVRVRNKSCVASNGTEILNVYFSKAATWTSWPQNWDGSIPTLGNIVGSVTLPVLQPGEVKIIKIPWTIPAALNTANWTPFCILARLENVAGDPIIGNVSSVELNNNVAIRNTMALGIGGSMTSIPGYTIDENIFYPLGGYIDIVNPKNTAEVYDFHFGTPLDNNGNIITDVAEVTVILDDSAWAAFQNATELVQDGVTILQDKVIKITSDQRIIKGVTLPANSRYTMYVGYQFLIDSFSTTRNYTYLVAQTYADSAAYLGGENIVLRQETRIPFNANAGNDKYCFPGDTVTLTATEIYEPVIYKWYEGSILKHTGRVYNLAVDSLRTYTLEVTSLTDGSIDYDEVKVKLKHGTINSVYPNPCTNSATITYLLEGVNNASLLVVHPIYLNQQIVPLNINNTSATLDMSSIPTGVYSIILVGDNTIQDIRSLIKQ